MQNELMNEGLTLMLAGMGTVFAFLTALVVVMIMMSQLIMRLQPVVEPKADRDEEVAAITAAIAQHRRKRT